MILKKTCEIIGVSGYENRITDYIMDLLNKRENVYKDNVGNLIYYKKGTCSKNKIMIMAHVDEVGFQITKKIDENKFKFKILGNVKTWNSNNQKVIFSNGSRGVIFSEDESNISLNDFDNMYLFSLDDTINIGDTFTFFDEFMESDNFYIGKGLDNRICCYLMVKSILEDICTVNDVFFVFSVQEEIGMRGAKVAISHIQPDIVLCLDVSPVCKNNNIDLENGVAIKISDSIGVSNPDLVNNIEKIAEKNNIKYQLEVSDCGTSELIMINEIDMGSKNVGLSLPCLFMHTPNVIVNKEDVNNMYELILKILENV